MRTFWIVKALDVHECGTLEFFPVTKMPSIQLLFLEKFEEGLHNRIVVWIAGRRERLHDIVHCAPLSRHARGKDPNGSFL